MTILLKMVIIKTHKTQGAIFAAPKRRRSYAGKMYIKLPDLAVLKEVCQKKHLIKNLKKNSNALIFYQKLFCKGVIYYEFFKN